MSAAIPSTVWISVSACRLAPSRVPGSSLATSTLTTRGASLPSGLTIWYSSDGSRMT